MSKKRRIVFAMVVLAVLLVGGGSALVYVAAHHVPRFYEDAVNIAPMQQKRGSDEMLRRSAALASDANRRGRWQAIFAADQINGWLAVDLVQNHPKLLPPELHDPRVAIRRGQIIIGCRFNGQLSTVVSLEADVSLQETNVIAVRIRRARAGAIPLPLDKFMPEAIRSLQNAGFLVELRQSGADPVLLVTLQLQPDSGRSVLLKTLVLRDDEVDVAGETK